ncbi:MAG: hypothetical protein RL325_1880, partial [Planctomycetota bacterium]
MLTEALASLLFAASPASRFAPPALEQGLTLR